MAGGNRGNAARLVLLCGLPCSGKTTLARRIEAATDAVVFSPDEWMIELRVDLWNEEFRGRLERTMWGLATHLLERGVSVILDYGYWARSERDEKRVGARELGVEVELRYLETSIEELVRRVNERNSSAAWRDTAPITREHLLRWSAMLEPPDPAELALFDEPIPLDH